jgi:hypoxanthine phosphoribosyltransferase
MSLLESLFIFMTAHILVISASILVVALLDILVRKVFPLHLTDRIKGGFYFLGSLLRVLNAKRRIFFSGERALTETKRLYKSIKNSTFQPGIIVGITGGNFVGGGIIALLLASPKIGYSNLQSTCLNLKRDEKGNPEWEKCQSIIDICCNMHIKETDQILVVDDMTNTGHTIDQVVQELSKRLKNKRSEEPKIRAATIVTKHNAHSFLQKQPYWDDKFCRKILKADIKVEFPWKSEVPY